MQQLFGSDTITEIIRDNLNKTGKSGVWTEWSATQYRRVGGVLVPNVWILDAHNLWHNDGEEWLSKAVFSRNDSVGLFDTLYIGLDNRGTPLETDDLDNISGEPSGNNYAREAVNTTATGSNQWTASDSGGTWQAKTAQKTFTATGGAWTAVQQAFLTDQLSATTGQFLIATTALSGSRTLNDGDSLNIDLTVKVREPTGG